MAMVIAVQQTNYIERTKIARKASGMKAKAIAAALGMNVAEYRVYETSIPLPSSLIDGFCVLTRISPDYLLYGHRADVGQHSGAQSFKGIVAPLNRCGAPCPYGPCWCHMQCLPESK